MQTELIIVSEYCHKCHIEPSFIEMLEEGGLINVHTEGGEHYLLLSELPNVERYSRMYYDLSINMEGIDAIHHLLERMEDSIRASVFSGCLCRYFIIQYTCKSLPDSVRR